MKKQVEKKVPLTLKVPESLFNEIVQEAESKGTTRTDVALYRLQHYPIPLTPALMTELQNKANVKYEQLKDDMPDEALKIQREVSKLWKLLK